MEFFGGVIFTKIFRVNPYASKVSPYFMEVFRGECNFSQSSRVRRKGKSSTGGGGVRIFNAIVQFCSLPKPWTNQLARVNINSKQPGFPTCGCFWNGSRQAAKTKALILCHYFLFVCLLTFSSPWKMLKMLQQEHIPEEHEVKCQTTRSLESTLKNHQIGSVTRRENPVETLKNLRYGSDEKNKKVVIKDINHRR